jgi:hypothetical protein
MGKKVIGTKIASDEIIFVTKINIISFMFLLWSHGNKHTLFE